MANIFQELSIYARKHYPILSYYGLQLSNRLDETWGYVEYPENDTYSKRLRNIMSLVKAKTLRNIFEKGHSKLEISDIVLQLCPNDLDLANVTTKIVNRAIGIDKNVQRSLRKSWNDKVFIPDEELNKLVCGPLITGSEYDYFINSSVTLNEEVSDFFVDVMLDSFDKTFDVYEGSTHIDVSKHDLDYLKEAHILKNNAVDLIEMPTGGYMFCVDVNKRFKDGNQITTDAAWIFGQKEGNSTSIVIIE